GRHARAGEAVEHDEGRIDLPEVPEQLGPGAPHLDDADRGRRDLARVDDTGVFRQPGIRNAVHADVAGRVRTGERVEQRRLAGARQPDNPDLEGQATAPGFRGSASAATRAPCAATT